MADQLYCADIHAPFVEQCLTMAEWSTFWTAFGVIVTIIVTFGGGAKLFWELGQLRKQRQEQLDQTEEEASLRRTEFFLSQHRRLFDDKDLYEVLCYLDGDDPWLLNLEMWDKKRKFLTFIEEIAFLVNSKKIKPDVAYYMFGHYARRARYGENFNKGIDTAASHWWVFRKFVADSEAYERTNPEHAQTPLKL
ncbi:MAG TPA: hypothetical protein VJ654_18540 [Noviherbaspirillum sp.]|nr:hypothetical protein [Noviherbaspirillum sp.]